MSQTSPMKQISTDQLRVGMYVHKLCCSWLTTPFWQSSFLVGHFDEKVFAAFVKCLGIYPVGTLVRLRSGRLGVVTEQPLQGSLLQPRVKVFFSSKSQTYIAPVLLDLAQPGAGDAIVGCEEAAAWGLSDIDRFWTAP